MLPVCGRAGDGQCAAGPHACASAGSDQSQTTWRKLARSQPGTDGDTPRPRFGGRTMANTSPTEIREAVREHYASAARQSASGAFEEARRAEATAGCGCPPVARVDDGSFGAVLYDKETSADVSCAAVEASLGCGVPTAVADLHDGETVLDLGSGAGADVLISAGRVGPSGKGIGLDMTDEML